MAAGGKGLTGVAPVTDQLLSHVSSHVISETRMVSATRVLGLSNTEYGHVEEDKRSASERNIEVKWVVFLITRIYFTHNTK